MAIFPIENLGSNETTETSTKNSADTIDKNEFLMLFVAQLQNQDPLSPMDNAQLAEQTAQFASLEQLQYINNNLQNLQKFQSALFDGNAVSFIGKSIRATDNAISLQDEASAEINFDLQYDATDVYVSIYDENDGLVATVDSDGPLPAGQNSLIWDGNLNDGVTRAPEGFYYVEILAENSTLQTEDGDPLNFMGVPFFEGTVSAVNFWDGTAYLSADGRDIAIGNVQKVSNGG